MTAALQTLTPIERFWRNVEQRADGHWLWHGPASVNLGTRTQRVSRRPHLFAWTLTRGPLENGEKLWRQCNEPRCVAPAHYRPTWEPVPVPVPLTLPPAERTPERQPLAPLPWLPPLTLAQLRWYAELGDSPAQLAPRFGLNPSDVERLLHGTRSRRGTKESAS